MITRIMAVGRGRFIEAACSLSFDYNFRQRIDKTYVIIPGDKELFFETIKPFDIDTSNIQVFYDHDVIQTHRLDRWQHQPWYLQQALKLSLLDQLGCEYFLIQDCDLIPIQYYDLFINNTPHFRVEYIRCDSQTQEPFAAYTRCESNIQKLIGFGRPRNLTFVTEIMPMTKNLWRDCKTQIENKLGVSWQQAIPDIQAFDDTQWFSEYELLGFFASGRIPNLTYSFDGHPIINSWKDFYESDWTQTAICKTGLARPLKFMSAEEGLKLIKHFKTLFKYAE
jgi:hypothetical protein